MKCDSVEKRQSYRLFNIFLNIFCSFYCSIYYCKSRRPSSEGGCGYLLEQPFRQVNYVSYLRCVLFLRSLRLCRTSYVLSWVRCVCVLCCVGWKPRFSLMRPTISRNVFAVTKNLMLTLVLNQSLVID